MKCHFCGRHAPADMNQVVDDGWVPSFWDGEDEVCEPVCGECCETRLELDVEDGELILRPLQPMTFAEY